MVLREFVVVPEAGKCGRRRPMVPDQGYHREDFHIRGIEHERGRFGESRLELHLLRIIRVRRTPRREFKTVVIGS